MNARIRILALAATTLGLTLFSSTAPTPIRAAVAATAPTGPGPMTFTAFDQNGDGVVDQSEFDAVRASRQEAVRSSGRMGRGMANAPTFDQIDTDRDGRITQEEFSAIQQNRFNQRPGRGAGRGRGRGGWR